MNNAPILDASASPSLPESPEGSGNPVGVKVSTLVVDGSVVDLDGAVEAIAVTQLNTSLGTWQYSLDNGASWLTIRTDLINSTTNELALLLGPTAELRLLPFGELSGTLANAVTFRAWDTSVGTEGTYEEIVSPGTPESAFSGTSNSAAITVTAVNDAPTFSPPRTFLPAHGSGKLFSGSAKGVVVQPDGKIVVARTLETSFSGGAAGVMLQPDGKVLAIGDSGSDPFVVRLNADGSPDSSFAEDGKATLPGDAGSIVGANLLADGKILLLGVSSVIRLNVDGSLDTSFSDDGRADIATYLGLSAIQADGKIVTAGPYASWIMYEDEAYYTYGLTVARLNENGSLDGTFSDDGSAFIQVGSVFAEDADVFGLPQAYSGGIAIQLDGKIIVYQVYEFDENFSLELRRLNADGTLDGSFAGNGGSIPVDGVSRISITLQPDGKIILGISGRDYYFVRRLNQDGSRDTSFRDAGIPVTVENDTFYNIDLQPDGKIVVVGRSDVFGEDDTVSRVNTVYRLNTDGSLDTTSLDSAILSTLGASVGYVEGGQPIALDGAVAIHDVELASLNGAAGNYAGASVTLERADGPDATDVFSARGKLAFSGGNVLLSGVVVGGVSNDNGTLTITFGANATQARVNEVLSSIGYSNSSDALPSTVRINWTFDDGNDGSQGEGGALIASGSTTVNITRVNDGPTGAVTISGITTQGQTLTASNTLADPDGLGTIGYQWKANGVAIEGAARSNYTLVEADIGKVMSVTASYTDGQGTVESVSSEATSAVVGLPGVIFTGAAGLATTEAGGTGSFEVALRAQPTDDVFLTLTIGDGTEGNFQSSGTTAVTLAFTVANWNAKQSVTVVGLDDSVHDGHQSYVIQTSISSGDAAYDGMQSGVGFPIADITVTNSDDEVPDELYGDAGGIPTADLLNGGKGASDIYGLFGNDELHGNNGNDRLYGGYGDDVLNGDAGNDELEGEQGNDTLDGGTGADRMAGGAGDDTYYVDNTGDVVVEANGQGFDAVLSSVSFSVGGQFVENLTLTGIGDIDATGNSLDNVLTGNSGDNILRGGKGNDTLDGRAGDDALDGGAGADRMVGGAGNDTYHVDNAGDVMVEANGQGADTVLSSVSFSLGGQYVENLTLTGSGDIDATGNTLRNVLTGNGGANTLRGGGGDDTLDGGVGDDTLNGGAGADRMVGGTGNDTYYVNNAGDVVVEANGQGTDTVLSSVSFSVGGQFVENLTLVGSGNIDAIGNSLNNVLTGNGGNNILRGGKGNDTLNGGSGTDQMVGGEGNDTLYVEDVGDVVIEADGQGIDTVISSMSFSLDAQFVENLTLTGGANIDATGNSFANVLVGNAGRNKLIGGRGDDTYVVQTVGDRVVELAGEGTDSVQSSVTFSIAGQFVENLTLTGRTNIDATGNSFGNAIVGNAGRNKLTGGRGDDTYVVQTVGDRVVELNGEGTDSVQSSVTFSIAGQFVENLTLTGGANIDATGNSLGNVLVGNAGRNKLTGGRGDDTYVVQTVGDRVVELNGEGTDSVQSSATFSIAGQFVENLTLTGSANIDATGNSFGNVIVGNAGRNKLTGGRGDDTYVVQTVGDRVFELASEGTDSVQSSVTFSLAGQFVENLTLTGGANIDATGNSFGNTLIGNSGNNVLNGGFGADVISGGAGSDTFEFTTSLVAGNIDTILDFSVAADSIRLGHVIFNGIVGALSAAEFVANASGIAGDTDDRIIYETDTGKLFYDGNGSAAGGAVQFAQLSSGLDLTANNFSIV